MSEHSPPHLCPACGYDIDPPDPSSPFECPECGRWTDRESSCREAIQLQRFAVLRSALAAILVPQVFFTTYAVIFWNVRPPGVLGTVLILIWLGAVLFLVPMSLCVSIVAWATQPPPFRRWSHLLLIVLAALVAVAFLGFSIMLFGAGGA